MTDDFLSWREFMKLAIELQNLTTLVVGSCLLTLVSCGNDKKERATPVQNPIETRQELTGRYHARLLPVAGASAYGHAHILVTDDLFSVSVKMSDLTPSLSHRQAIYATSSCPISSAEAARSILIPLDGDLSSQLSRGYGFPFSDSYGQYSYAESVHRSVLLSDLRSGPAAGEGMVKLAPAASLNLAGKVIVVRGTVDDENQPVACGQIVRIGGVEHGSGSKD
jgi:hypothetical protein